MVRTFIAGLVLLAAPALAEPTGTLRTAHNLGSGIHSSLDPISKGRILQITEKVMSRLLRPGADGSPEPDLAVKWVTNPAATVWWFTLREDVSFHDGSDFSAADVVYSFERVLDPERDSPSRSVISMVSEVRAVNDQTVEFKLAEGFPDLPLQLMDYRMRIIPEGSDDTIAATGIGTGPFKVSHYDYDGITVLEAFDNYWEGAPKLEQIDVIAIPDTQARLQAFLGGQLDMERGIDPVLRRALAKSDHYALQEIPTGNWSGLVFRTDIPPMNDARVRKALKLAVNRQELLDLAMDGGGIMSCDSPVAPDDQYRADMDCPQNLDHARELLNEAGHGHGVDLDVYVAGIDPSWSTMALAFQKQVAAAGFNVEVKQAASDGYWSEIWMKKDAFATSWGARPADQALSEPFHSDAKWNESQFKDPGYDAMLADARGEIDFIKRRAMYQKAQHYLYENSGTIIPFHVTQLVGLSSRVKNMPAQQNNAIRWHLVEVEE